MGAPGNTKGSPPPGRKWEKGQSGNPNGRPKEAYHVRDLARQHAEEAIRTLVTLMKSARNEKVRVQAASAILDRAVGKPIQETKVKGDPLNPVLVGVYVPDNHRD